MTELSPTASCHTPGRAAQRTPKPNTNVQHHQQALLCVCKQVHSRVPAMLTRAGPGHRELRKTKGNIINISSWVGAFGQVLAMLFFSYFLKGSEQKFVLDVVLLFLLFLPAPLPPSSFPSSSSSSSSSCPPVLLLLLLMGRRFRAGALNAVFVSVVWSPHLHHGHRSPPRNLSALHHNGPDHLGLCCLQGEAVTYAATKGAITSFTKVAVDEAAILLHPSLSLQQAYQ